MPIIQREDAPLFSPSLITPEVLALLPEGYSARPLRRSDYHLGYWMYSVSLPPSETSHTTNGSSDTIGWQGGMTNTI